MQLESRHFFRTSDSVRHSDGRAGTVVESFALYAEIRWTDGSQQEVDQFDSAIEVVIRAESG
ncbi:MAG TPA: hypothetical protein VFI91_14585 [Longimicrobiaceae bacterium]|nr:hypothetical protein [Longimicrobiaceae bacterium]